MEEKSQKNNIGQSSDKHKITRIQILVKILQGCKPQDLRGTTFAFFNFHLQKPQRTRVFKLVTGSRILLMNLFEPYMTPINLRDEKIRSSFAEAETELTRVLAVLEKIQKNDLTDNREIAEQFVSSLETIWALYKENEIITKILKIVNRIYELEIPIGFEFTSAEFVCNGFCNILATFEDEELVKTASFCFSRTLGEQFSFNLASKEIIQALLTRFTSTDSVKVKTYLLWPLYIMCKYAVIDFEDIQPIFIAFVECFPSYMNVKNTLEPNFATEAFGATEAHPLYVGALTAVANIVRSYTDSRIIQFCDEESCVLIQKLLNDPKIIITEVSVAIFTLISSVVSRGNEAVAQQIYNFKVFEKIDELYFIADVEAQDMMYWTVSNLLQAITLTPALVSHLVDDLRYFELLYDVFSHTQFEYSVLSLVESLLVVGEQLENETVIFNPFALKFATCGGVAILEKLKNQENYLAETILETFYDEEYTNFLARQRGLKTKKAHK